jgi:hypothetical protein
VSWPSYFTELDCLKWSLMARCKATHSYRISIIRMLMSIKLSCMTYHRVGNTTGAHIEILTLPEHLSSPSGFSRVRVARSLMFCVMFCRSLFVLLSFFALVIVLSVLLFMAFHIRTQAILLSSYLIACKCVLVINMATIVSNWLYQPFKGNKVTNKNWDKL